MRRITSEMIEAAAAAIHAQFANRSGRGRQWHQLPDAVRKNYRLEAAAALRAALEA
jgi:hypothetical protein